MTVSKRCFAAIALRLHIFTSKAVCIWSMGRFSASAKRGIFFVTFLCYLDHNFSVNGLFFHVKEQQKTVPVLEMKWCLPTNNLLRTDVATDGHVEVNKLQ